MNLKYVPYYRLFYLVGCQKTTQLGHFRTWHVLTNDRINQNIIFSMELYQVFSHILLYTCFKWSRGPRNSQPNCITRFKISYRSLTTIFRFCFLEAILDERCFCTEGEKYKLLGWSIFEPHSILGPSLNFAYVPVPDGNAIF